MSRRREIAAAARSRDGPVMVLTAAFADLEWRKKTELHRVTGKARVKDEELQARTALSALSATRAATR
jgi:hypothetical protein